FALNRMDEARAKRRFINVRALAAKLGGPVVPTVAHMGIGLAELFTTLTRVARETRKAPPVPWAHAPSPHIVAQWGAIAEIARQPEVAAAFAVPEALLTLQLAENEDYFAQELQAHFPDSHALLLAVRAKADAALPRPLAEEIHADRHHRAAVLFEAVTRPGQADETPRWQRWADDLFLHPQWGFVGTLVIFAMVLFFVFEVSAFLDGLTVARLIAWAEPWQPTDLLGVLARAVLDGIIGLAGIVIPYMIPLVMLLVVLEESGIMHRVAFVVDRGFHQLGLHGGVALPFLMGLGCNVPALAATAAVTRGRDRTVASLLITFLPCSARSAILLAVGGKYLGGFGVFALFMLIPVVVSLVGKLLQRRYPETTPGIIQEIPAYALPTPRQVFASTWERSRDIVTIVLPLLVAGSVVLALLDRYGADAWINLTLIPITTWWLGLPVALGVPILFGVLRKELSLLMVFQALGTQELSSALDTTQIVTFLVFLTFYVPCVSTFAMMLKLLGRRDAYYSVVLSIGVALVVAAAVRWPLELVGWLV
ncbi:MAG: ferrous iron transporter B, partial [Chromatiaceae bacterium]|nr:ferrous iron transporter B [Chromatiaceae bacterium]